MNIIGLETAVAGHLSTTLQTAWPDVSVRAAHTTEELSGLTWLVTVEVTDCVQEAADLWTAELQLLAHTPAIVVSSSAAEEHGELERDIRHAVDDGEYALLAAAVWPLGLLLQGHYVPDMLDTQRHDGKLHGGWRLRLGLEEVAPPEEWETEAAWEEPLPGFSTGGGLLLDNRGQAEEMECEVPAGTRQMVIGLAGSVTGEGVWEGENNGARIVTVPPGGVAVASWATI